MFKKIIVAIALFSVGTLGGIGQAQANHSWGGYHWARTTPEFTLRLGDNVSGAWDGYLNNAVADWNPSTVIDLAVVPSNVRPKTCKPTAGRVEVCNARYGRNGWLGLASIWYDGNGHITQATVKFNDSYSMSAAEKQMVACQEIAHAFGLDHQDEQFDNPNLGSCMDYTSNVLGPPSNVHPNQHDFDELELIYNHVDGYSTSNVDAASKRDRVFVHVFEAH